MRFSTSALLAVLPVLAAAQESPLDQFKVQLQSVLNQVISYIPNPGRYDPVAALEAKVGAMKLSILTLENWKETLYEPVAPDATKPEEWWVLISGRNKTCFGAIWPLSIEPTDGMRLTCNNRPLRQCRPGFQ